MLLIECNKSPHMGAMKMQNLSHIKCRKTAAVLAVCCCSCCLVFQKQQVRLSLLADCSKIIL